LGALNAILEPLELVVAWLMVGWHTVFTALGMPEASGWTWTLSIVGLVVVIRILLIPLFVKQIKASRGLQLIQPEMKKIQAKYKGKTDQASRQAMSQETMALYKRTGTNPFASCLPILLQAPIFFALFRVLNGIGKGTAIGALTPDLVAQAQQAEIFGARLSASFLGSDDPATKIVCVVLIILMSLTSFTTQRQLMMKNMPAAALESPFAQQQKLLLYIFPLVFAVSGVNFPIGVLIYWLTTNLWSMGQQFYVIRRMPAPGSAAEAALLERRKSKGKGVEPVDAAAPQDTPEPPVGQRQQPKRLSKSQRKGAGSSASPSPTAAASEKAQDAPPSDGQSNVADPNGADPNSDPNGAEPNSAKPKGGGGAGTKASNEAKSKRKSQAS
jgi:YidC/Oxa1 family membrane protein insertase